MKSNCCKAEMKIVDLTIFNDIKEEDIGRVAEREWICKGELNLSVQIRKDQEEQLLKLNLPRWRDGRTNDGKRWKKYKMNKKVNLIKVYETDFGLVPLIIL